MGLSMSHDAWDGAYSSFMRWRIEIAELGGFPPLKLMEGFHDNLTIAEKSLPIKWPSRVSDLRLIPLLTHSDCEGDLSVAELREITPALERLVEFMADGSEVLQNTVQFIEGAKLAIADNEPIDFH